MNKIKWVRFFEEKMKSSFPESTVFNYSDFLEGEFGNLTRIEFEYNCKLGTIDLWSSDWVSIDIFDTEMSEQVLNILCSPDEEKKIVDSFYKVLEIVGVKT